MALNGTNTVRKKNHINNINHKIIQNCLEPPSPGQNHQELTKCTSTCRAQLERCLVSIFTKLSKIDRLTSTTGKARYF